MLTLQMDFDAKNRKATPLELGIQRGSQLNRLCACCVSWDLRAQGFNSGGPSSTAQEIVILVTDTLKRLLRSGTPIQDFGLITPVSWVTVKEFHSSCYKETLAFTIQFQVVRV